MYYDSNQLNSITLCLLAKIYRTVRRNGRVISKGTCHALTIDMFPPCIHCPLQPDSEFKVVSTFILILQDFVADLLLLARGSSLPTI